MLALLRGTDRQRRGTPVLLVQATIIENFAKSMAAISFMSFKGVWQLFYSM